ncbi:MAG: ECF-type sigma factor [Verrucomicrobiota bacterium]
MSELTFILQSIDSGNPQAAEALLPLVYDALRRLAQAKMAREPPDNAGRQRRSSRWLRGFHCRVDASVQHCDPAGMAVAVSYPHIIKPPGAAALLPACLSLITSVVFSP